MYENIFLLTDKLTALGQEGGPVGELLVGLGFSLILGLVLMLVYRSSQNSLSYNRQFNITLMMMALSCTILLSLIQDNPLFSLGALGALSICRIRINTRDPRNLGFVFWALTIGISSALGAYAIGLLGSLVLTLVILLLNAYGAPRKEITLIVRGVRAALPQVVEALDRSGKNVLLSQNVFAEDFELVYALKSSPQEQEQLLVALNALEGVANVNILAPETHVD